MRTVFWFAVSVVENTLETLFGPASVLPVIASASIIVVPVVLYLVIVLPWGQ